MFCFVSRKRTNAVSCFEHVPVRLLLQLNYSKNSNCWEVVHGTHGPSSLGSRLATLSTIAWARSAPASIGIRSRSRFTMRPSTSTNGVGCSARPRLCRVVEVPPPPPPPPPQEILRGCRRRRPRPGPFSHVPHRPAGPPERREADAALASRSQNKVTVRISIVATRLPRGT